MFTRVTAGAATALTLLLLQPGPARAEIITAETMARGITATPAQCAAQPSTVWVVVSQQGFCIRYYMSTAGGSGQVPVVLIEGDRLGTFDRTTRQFSKVIRDEDINTDLLQATAKSLSEQAKTTAIYLARLGVEGSSGHAGERWSWLELYALNHALDAIKRQHGFTGFHLVGQSGGANLVAGLLIVRSDIGCAVPGSGRLSLLGVEYVGRKEPELLRKIDPAKFASVIARRATRILVVTDPQDKYVALQAQTNFVQALLGAGGRVEHFYVNAADETHHFVRVYSAAAAVACIQGMSYPQIAGLLGRVQEHHLAAAQQRRNRQTTGT